MKRSTQQKEEVKTIKRTIRIGVIVVVSLLAVSLVTATALASSVHLKGGKNAEPAFTDEGLTLSASGEIAGLGEGNVEVTLTATANPIATCQNPGNGEHFPPGQNPAPVTVTGSVDLTPDPRSKNGNTPFSVETDPPVTPVPGAPDCSNSRWTEEITDMAFTSATITVEQPPGTVVLIVVCTFGSPTSNGPVPPGSVSCTST